MMNKRDAVIAVLKGEKIPVIPLLGECPMDVTVVKGELPPSVGDAVQDLINREEFYDNYSVGIGLGIGSKTISKDEKHHKYVYETGAVWLEGYQPTFFREALEFPIKTPEQAFYYKMPDAKDPERFNKSVQTETVKRLKEAGYFVQGNVMGAWASIYYYLVKFEEILIWMAIEKEAAHEVFKKTSRFSIESAKILLDCGVDCIFTVSDLGSGQGLLFSKDMFYEYVFPWLKELADLCHSYGAYLHLHSHGHIQDIMDGIVEAGVDILNPVGPSDYNDLKYFKDRWGDKLTLHGGISTKIAEMDETEMREHVKQVIEIGRTGGRFFPRTESGIPFMPREKILLYLNILKEMRQWGY